MRQPRRTCCQEVQLYIFEQHCVSKHQGELLGTVAMRIVRAMRHE